MTRDQWKLFENSMEMAPDILQEMYNTDRVEMTEGESLDLARAVRAGTTALYLVNQPNAKATEQDINMVVETTISMIAGMYGRLMGLARAYDEAITKQAVLEAELATTGK